MDVSKDYRKELVCGDLRADCDFKVRGETEEEVISRCKQHACSAHSRCTPPSPEIESKMRSHIKEILA